MILQKAIFSYYYEHLNKKYYLFILISDILFEDLFLIFVESHNALFLSGFVSIYLLLFIYFGNIIPIFTVKFEKWNSFLLNINIYIVKKTYWLQTFEL